MLADKVLGKDLEFCIQISRQPEDRVTLGLT